MKSAALISWQTLRRIRGELYNVWHHGQYNFPRTVKRDDPIAIAVGHGIFVQSAMKLCLILAKDYAPYWKWVAAEFRKRSENEEIDQELTELTSILDRARQVELVDSICEKLRARILATGIERQAVDSNLDLETKRQRPPKRRPRDVHRRIPIFGHSVPG